MKNVVFLCRTNNIQINASCDLADCISSIASICQKKSSGINVSVRGLVLRDECWLVISLLINEVNEILKYQCLNDFGFIFQDYAWTFANGSLDCSLFYQDLFHFIEQDNVNLAKSVSLTMFSLSLYNYFNLYFTNSNMSYKDITRQKV